MRTLTQGGEYDLFLQGSDICLAVWERDSTDAGDCSGIRLTPSEAFDLSADLRSLVNEHYSNEEALIGQAHQAEADE